VCCILFFIIPYKKLGKSCPEIPISSLRSQARKKVLGIKNMRFLISSFGRFSQPDHEIIEISDGMVRVI